MSTISASAAGTADTSVVATVDSATVTSPSLNSSSLPPQAKTFAEILSYSSNQALKGGVAGMAMQTINVFSFMWLRTTMNYQYRYGGSIGKSLRHLWKEGGAPRFYSGLVPALMQSPLSRFGDTAANVGVLALLDSSPSTNDLPIGVKTAIASAGAATWRLFLMPIDAWKTIKQVEGGSGLQELVKKVRVHGFPKLYHGSVASMSATWVGHFPWFFVHNYLSHHLPPLEIAYGKHVRNALIGFTASVVSDTCSNSIRVVKTTKQTSKVPLTYVATVKEVVYKDGLIGLFGRGLKIRIITNGLQVVSKVASHYELSQDVNLPFDSPVRF
ncbi:putative MC family transporter [Cardiosporidium cionae]|uniref:MC family transporter n=1 Tax=Cardiosporidium cionae TaxID=476202 RepID=A0ABQ7J4T3_9APIC|nr:putative MC family transporter [Cardiosporidium cionae]|eukprot:KAF8818148.1 putative MC family transporter [Cardiosporidium cionae]